MKKLYGILLILGATVGMHAAQSPSHTIRKINLFVPCEDVLPSYYHDKNVQAGLANRIQDIQAFAREAQILARKNNMDVYLVVNVVPTPLQGTKNFSLHPFPASKLTPVYRGKFSQLCDRMVRIGFSYNEDVFSKHDTYRKKITPQSILS
jgi:hypothetical protein